MATRRAARRRPKVRSLSAGKRLVIRCFGAIFLIAILLTAGLFVWSFQKIDHFGENEIVHFDVVSENKLEVVDKLVRERLVVHGTLMKLYVGVFTPGATLTPRSHLLRRGLSPRQLVQRLAEVGSREQTRVVFPEGWTHLQMAKRLEAAEVCSALGFQSAVRDQKLLPELGIRGPSAEGRLFPATYTFGVDTDPRAVVRRLVKESDLRYGELRATLAAEPDLTRLAFGDEETFILASIVEKETGIGSERPRVARVFLNRLLYPEAGTLGRLQSDPTAAYGCAVDPNSSPSCGDFTGKVTSEMLSDSANRYNTYRRPGLPPTAIANPGELSLRAVLAPASGDDFYFVADGAGGHIFSSNFEDHHNAVVRLRALRAGPKN